MTLTISEAKTVFDDRWPFATSMDSNLFKRFLASAVRYYSRYNPIRSTTTVVTTPDEDDYDLPSDCWLVRSVLYQEATYIGAGSMSDLADRRGRDPTDFSDILIDEVTYSAGRWMPWEKWSQEGSTLHFLEPFSTTAETLLIAYVAQHALNEAETAYATIPDEDFDLLVGLTLAEALEVRRIESAGHPDYVEGLQRMTVSRMPANIRIMVRDFRGAVERRYSGQSGGIW